MAECAGLLNRCRVLILPGVRIPPSPLLMLVGDHQAIALVFSPRLLGGHLRTRLIRVPRNNRARQTSDVLAGVASRLLLGLVITPRYRAVLSGPVVLELELGHNLFALSFMENGVVRTTISCRIFKGV